MDRDFNGVYSGLSLSFLMLVCLEVGIPSDKLAMLMDSSQGFSLLLATVLKAIGSRRYYDSDDEYAPERLPLLKNALHSPTTCVIGDPVFPSKNDTWSKRTDDKVSIHNHVLNC